MITNVHKYADHTSGVIGARGDALCLFRLEPIREGDLGSRWVYKGKVVGDTFIPADVQGYEHIPQEFYASLDRAWSDPNGHDEFPDPFLDNLEVAGA